MSKLLFIVWQLDMFGRLKNFRSDISWSLCEIHNLNSKASPVFQIFKSESCNCAEMFIENTGHFPTEILLPMKSIATFFHQT